MVALRPGAGMRGDHRPGGQLEHVLDTGRTEVGDVEEDAEMLHLGDCGHAGPGQSPAGPVLATAVGQRRAAEVGQRRDPDPEAVHRPEQLDVGIDARTTLQRQHEGDPPGVQRRVERRPVEAQRHLVGVVLGEPMRRFDHPQRLAQGALGAVGVVDEHRQDLDVDTTVTQLRQPVLPEVAGPAVRRPGDHRHQQVVVGVGHDRRPVQLLSVNRRHRSPSSSVCSSIHCACESRCADVWPTTCRPRPILAGRLSGCHDDRPRRGAATLRTMGTATANELAEQSAAAAAAAAARAGVEILPIPDADAAHRVSRLLSEIWANDHDQPIVPAEIIRTPGPRQRLRGDGRHRDRGRRRRPRLPRWRRPRHVPAQLHRRRQAEDCAAATSGSPSSSTSGPGRSDTV